MSSLRRENVVLQNKLAALALRRIPLSARDCRDQPSQAINLSISQDTPEQTAASVLAPPSPGSNASRLMAGISKSAGWELYNYRSQRYLP